ncbi:MAG TPA: hypothetical protein VEB42_14620 [Chitinophagaceae bacterium]|nr:hypothetical protein [Chitinophagaceae bacterium]
MASKDISDVQVLQAYAAYNSGDNRWPYEILQEITGEPEKVCYRAMERAYERDLIEYGCSLRSGWITEKGKTVLAEQSEFKL